MDVDRDTASNPLSSRLKHNVHQTDPSPKSPTKMGANEYHKHQRRASRSRAICVQERGFTSISALTSVTHFPTPLPQQSPIPFASPLPNYAILNGISGRLLHVTQGQQGYALDLMGCMRHPLVYGAKIIKTLPNPVRTMERTRESPLTAYIPPDVVQKPPRQPMAWAGSTGIGVELGTMGLGMG